jgi:hypothetical protein
MRRLEMNEYVYIKKKGVIYYVDRDSNIISYLLDKKPNKIIYIEQRSIDKLINILDSCHINYYFNNTLNKYNDNRYNNYKRYGELYVDINNIYKELINIIYKDDIDKIINNIRSLYKYE